MLTLSRQTPKRGTTCQRCLVIRYFVIGAVGMAIFALIAGDRLQLVGGFTPLHAGIAIVSVGMVGFVLRLVMWKLENRQAVSADPAPDEQPAAYREEIDQKPSR